MSGDAKVDPDPRGPDPALGEAGGTRVDRLAEGIGAVGTWTAGAAIAGTVAIILAEIVLRSVFATSLLVTEEMVGYLVSLAVFAGLAPAMREARMIRVSALLGVLRPRAAAALEIGLRALALAAALALAGFVARAAWRFFERGTTSNGVVKIPLWLPEALTLVGLLLLASVLALDIVSRIRGWRLVPKGRVPRD